MNKIIGIRREDKNIWERRVPLIPLHVAELKNNYGIQTILQPFERRAISEKEYLAAGAEYNEDLSKCSLILAVKEIPSKILMADKTYMFFSHTIKGQAYNMPMLKRFLELKCTLIDYECIKDEKDRRLVFFGKFAGLAGMIDALNIFGKRMKYLGFETPLLHTKPAYEYHDLEDAKKHIKELGYEIKKIGLPKDNAPYVFGFTGYGNVSQGAQEIFDLLPVEEITPEELLTLRSHETNKLFKVVFHEKHLVEPRNPNDSFELQDYFQHPEKYKSQFEKYIARLSLIVNAVYWDEKYPRFITKKFFKENFQLKTQLICDISCDINGAVEFTEKVTQSDNPSYVYNPKTGEIIDGYEGEGIVNIAVDNLPTELPRDASAVFSKSLSPFIHGIVNADTTGDFDQCNFPPEIKKAVICYKGELTKGFDYLKKYLK